MLLPVEKERGLEQMPAWKTNLLLGYHYPYIRERECGKQTNERH